MTEPALSRVGAPASLPRPSERPLSQVYDVALLDLDGVVYLGRAAVPRAPQALSEARRQGMRLAFVTNNASRSPSAIAAQLTGLGVPATPAEVVTSAHAAAHLLADRLPPGAPVLVVGGIGLRIALRERGLRPVSTAAERPEAVVQGYAPDIGYSLLAEAGLAVRAGAWFVAANVDTTLPTARGIQPGNGSLVQVIVTATGRQPVVAGKPEPPLHSEAVARTGARRPLVVGDRLDTDIEGAVRVGADSMLVLTGVTRAADAVLAPGNRRPTYLAPDLSGLLEAHPAVTAADGAYPRPKGDDPSSNVPSGASSAISFSCGGWTARRVPAAGAPPGPDGLPGRLEITGAGAPVDGLRALCAAAWTEGPVTADSVRAAVGSLPLP